MQNDGMNKQLLLITVSNKHLSKWKKEEKKKENTK